MRIIQPEAHILPFSGDVLKHVERCGRIAYKSEDAITDDSHVKFIQHLIQRGHESVLEHGNYVFELNIIDHLDFVKLENLIYNRAIYLEKGYSKRLRFSAVKKCVVSGNIRAWRDFIRMCQIVGFALPEWLHNAFYDNPAFFDLGLEPLQGEFKQLQRDDLTPEEQHIHLAETVLFTCSRAISHELVRHRALSPTQESQRYCNYSKGKFGGEVTFIEPEYYKLVIKESYYEEPDLSYVAAHGIEYAYHNGGGRFGLSDEAATWFNSVANAEKAYMELLNMGMQPQQAREVLPNSTKTEVVMTGTVGEWIHFFNLRCAEDAHPEMRRLAKPLRTEFNVHYTV